jgi:hypothetical protein
MKRTGRLAIGFATMATVGLLTAGPGPAAQEPGGCSLETLRGQYMVSASGTLFPPAFGVSQASTSNAAGYSVYNGDGTGTDWVTFTVNGNNVGVPSPANTTYTLNPDCTGTRTVLPNGPHFNIFVAADGSGLTQVATDPGFAASEFDTRARRSRALSDQ